MKFLKLLPITLFFIVMPRMSDFSGLNFSHILTEADYRYEAENTEPGVTILDPYQEYKNYWYCFKGPRIETRCLDWVEAQDNFQGGPKKQDASVTIYNSGITFDFSLYSQEMKNGCGSQLEEWKKIIKNGEDICIYGAHLQSDTDIDLNEKYVILDIYAIKTEHGIWSYFVDGRIPGTNASF